MAGVALGPLWRLSRPLISSSRLPHQNRRSEMPRGRCDRERVFHPAAPAIAGIHGRVPRADRHTRGGAARWRLVDGGGGVQGGLI